MKIVLTALRNFKALLQTTKKYSYCPSGVTQWASHPPQEQKDSGSNPAKV
jgi:hypothetical protein